MAAAPRGASPEGMIDAANRRGQLPAALAWATEARVHHGERGSAMFRQAHHRRPLDRHMCLTESHCVTTRCSNTRAEPQADGTYSISGTKVFITARARLHRQLVPWCLRPPDAPAGVKGISLFIVPKMRVSRDGVVGERNAVRCGALEHKMGIHGSATCVMNFDGAEGYLIGAPNKGLIAMFTMMNTARLAVGLQGLAVDRAYQKACVIPRALADAFVGGPEGDESRPIRS